MTDDRHLTLHQWVKVASYIHPREYLIIVVWACHCGSYQFTEVPIGEDVFSEQTKFLP